MPILGYGVERDGQIDGGHKRYLDPLECGPVFCLYHDRIKQTGFNETMCPEDCAVGVKVGH